MSAGISLFRKTLRTESARQNGADFRAQKLVTDGPQLSYMIGQIATMPAIEVASPVVTDPASPHFGKFRFILGISRLGGEDVML